MRLHALVILLALAGTGCTGPAAKPDPAMSDAARPDAANADQARPVSQQPLRARAGHTATLLPDGRVLLAGGCAVDGCTTSEVEPSSEFYVPGRGFVPGPKMVHPRSSHTATKLPDGRVLIVGGWAREGTEPLAEAEIFDPATGTFKPAGTLQGGAIQLADGRVLIADGTNVKVFDPASGSVTSGPAMPLRRQSVPLVLPDGRILITGGLEGRSQGVSSTVIFDPRTGESRPGPTMSSPRFKHAMAMLDDGRILVLGGTTNDTELLATTEILDLAANRSTPGPTMSGPRYKFPTAVVRTTTGRLVVAGGSQVDVLAPDGRSFTAISAGTGARRWVPSATALPDGTVLVVGGYDERIRVLGDAHIIKAV